ncbi:MAG: tyrosine-type recombinase/integrase [Gemmatimonadaceae bacterium]
MSWINKRKTRRGDRWDARVYLGGEQGSIYKTCNTKGEADTWARAQETRKDKGDHLIADKRTLAQYLSAWLTLKSEGAVKDRSETRRAIGPRTMDDYRRGLTEWIIAPEKKELRRVGHIRIDRVTYTTLNSLYESMRKFTTVGTIKKLNRLLGQAFVGAVKIGVLARNPADFADVPQVAAGSDESDDEDGASSSSSMTVEQTKQFLTAARTAAEAEERDGLPHLVPERCWSALWHVLACCGLRPGEAFALKWADVTWAEGTEAASLKVNHNLVRVRGVAGYQLRKPKTKSGKRTVPLIPEAAEELRRWRIQQKRQRLLAGAKWSDKDFVFTTSKGTPLHGARRSFERVCARAELGEWGEEPKREHASGPLKARKFISAFRIYDLRHTFGTLLVASGVPLNVVAALMGHTNAVLILSIYGHALPNQTQDAPRKLGALLFA